MSHLHFFPCKFGLFSPKKQAESRYQPTDRGNGRLLLSKVQTCFKCVHPVLIFFSFSPFLVLCISTHLTHCILCILHTRSGQVLVTHTHPPLEIQAQDGFGGQSKQLSLRCINFSKTNYSTRNNRNQCAPVTSRPVAAQASVFRLNVILQRVNTYPQILEEKGVGLSETW